MKDICPKEQCTGCTACINACGKSAISMVPDALGFMYPKVDESLCVNCGLCEKSCPNNYSVQKNYPIDSFVGHASDPNEQLTSTSGGIASVISRWCIQNDGVVYGCTARDIMHVQHVRVSDERELEWLKGSKYVQSDMGNCFSQVRDDLKVQKLVVFVGTPCQCAGLKAFLRKDYENLYLIDFVCHGVPSQKILNEELKLHISNEQEKSAVLSFRRKYKKKDCYKTQYGIFLTGENGRDIYGKGFPANTYITGFLTALFYRHSCYQCHYTTPERVSDITLGDFGDHGNDYASMEGRKRLLSMLTVNTKKGGCLFEKIKDSIISASISYDQLISLQGQLNHPMPKHSHRSDFEKKCLQEGYVKTANAFLKDDKKRILRIRISSSVRSFLYHVPYMNIILKRILSK